jgi:hypothetical protein
MNSLEAKDMLASMAYAEGRNVGKHGGSPSLNTYPVGGFEYIEFERGRMSAVAEQLKPLNRKPCRYHKNVICYCGGTFQCLDAV